VTASDTREETQPDRWKRLMLAAQDGQQRDYATFLREAAVFIRVIARRHHRNTGLIEDVVQETLTSIHRMRHTYEPGRPVEPWVAAIAKARSIDVLRRHTRISKRETGQDADMLSTHPDRGASTERRLVSESVIADAMAGLTDAQREAVRLLKFEELSLSEASSVSGLSVQALKSALHRAMQNLRTSLTGGSDA
jgi:RNA polymerase sigma-70 factor (ECF subfamily)